MQDMEIPFSGSKSTLLGLIKELGFKHVKLTQVAKNQFGFATAILWQILKYRDEGRPIFYTAESYVHTTHLPNHSWTDRSSKCVKKSVAS
jgi:hypothetical protein